MSQFTPRSATLGRGTTCTFHGADGHVRIQFSFEIRQELVDNLLRKGPRFYQVDKKMIR
jgi:hypothetical protein